MRVLVWDASGLHHPARAERLDVLGDIAKRFDNVTTAAVLDELDTYVLGEEVRLTGWVRAVHVDGLTELPALVRWTNLLSVDVHHRGEATVCAWAEVHGATAIIDDADARVAAAKGGVDVHGSLWVMAGAVRDGALAEVAADRFVELLVREGARFPDMPNGFSAWARSGRMI
jgi:predicted nucleic acid-binding protein